MARGDVQSFEKVSVDQRGGGAGSGTGNDPHYELGLMYCLGRGVPHDLVTAHKWFNISALRGNKAAREYRSEISREMDKADVAVAQKLAREWLAKH